MNISCCYLGMVLWNIFLITCSRYRSSSFCSLATFYLIFTVLAISFSRVSFS